MYVGLYCALTRMQFTAIGKIRVYVAGYSDLLNKYNDLLDDTSCTSIFVRKCR